MTRADALFALARRRLRRAGVRNDAQEAGWLLEHFCGVARGDLPLKGGQPCDEAPVLDALRRREAGEPLQYILGEWEFMGLSFYVGPGVLIPRADTELLAETALGFLKRRPEPRLLDLCAGTGCLAVSVSALCPGCRAVAVDLSEHALACARRNIARHRLGGRVRAARADMLKGPPAGFPRGFDALVCNPPYIRRGQLDGSRPSPVEESVRRFEPRMALDGGPDGLDFYRAAALWTPLLKPGGFAAFEIGFDEGESVPPLLERAGLRDISLRFDLSGLPRVAAGFRKA